MLAVREWARVADPSLHEVLPWLVLQETQVTGRRSVRVYAQVQFSAQAQG